MITPVDEDVQPPQRIWTSCCLRMDSIAVVYFSQLFLSSIVLFFCFYMLAYSGYDCQKSSSYWAAVSMVLGVFLGRSTSKK